MCHPSPLPSEAEQEVVRGVAKMAEDSFVTQDPALSYWWTGLQDSNDDTIWTWSNGDISHLLLLYFFHTTNIALWGSSVLMGGS